MFNIRIAYKLNTGKTRIIRRAATDKVEVVETLDTAKLTTGLNGVSSAAVVVTSGKTGRKIRYNYAHGSFDKTYRPEWGYDTTTW